MAVAPVLAGLAVYSAGSVTVYVHEKKPDGHRIWLPVPAVLVDLGVRMVPDRKLKKVSSKLRPWLPAIEAASRELARCPDGPFVEVMNPNERVTIVKRGDSLVIDVDSQTETVHVSVPIRVLASVAQRLDAASASL